MPETLAPLLGAPILVSEFLVGSKRAVLVDDRLYVSPAMFGLIQVADEHELGHLLSNLPVLVLPRRDQFGDWSI